MCTRLFVDRLGTRLKGNVPDMKKQIQVLIKLDNDSTKAHFKDEALMLKGEFPTQYTRTVYVYTSTCTTLLKASKTVTICTCMYM